MAEVENHFTVFIRLPFNRGDFIDPPPVAWSAAKERALWDILSRQAKGNEIDWRSLSERFEVTQPFLLQQAAWLYERQLSQVRAQMRRVGTNRQSTTPSPVPGSTTASMVGGQAMKRGGSGGGAGGSRVPSRLSTQAMGSPVPGGGGGGGGDSSTPGTPAKSRSSLPFRNTSGPGSAVAIVLQTQTQTRTMPGSTGTGTGTSRPISRQSFKDPDTPTSTYNTAMHTTQSRRGSIQQQQHQQTRSPGQMRTVQPQPQPQSSDSDDDMMTQSRMTARRPNPSSMHRRAMSLRKELQQPQRGSTASPNELRTTRTLDVGDGDKQDDDNDDDDDDDDAPSFLPFATPITVPEPVQQQQQQQQPNSIRPSSSSRQQQLQQDPSATLRGAAPFAMQQQQQQQQGAISSRPAIGRRTTSERIGSPSPTSEPPTTTGTSTGTPAVQSQRSLLPRATASPGPSSTTPGLTTTPTTTPTTMQKSNQTQPQTRFYSQTQNQTQNQNQNQRQNLTPSPNPNPNPNPNPHPHPLSPQHRALMMQSSPRRHPATGSDTSPSMGSSFSDLDDASVTQSALEEALLSGMGNTTTMTIPGTGIGVGVAGRVSGISQALRSRYFDGQQRGGGNSDRGGGGGGGVSER